MINSSQQIFFKKISKQDLEIIKSWRNSSGVWEFNTQYILLNKINQERWFSEISKKESNQKMFMILNSQKQPIGICGFRYLDDFNKSADISIILGKEKYRGKEYGPKALEKLVNFGFKKLNLHHISARIFEYNYRSIKAFEKLNFKLDGILRQCIWRNGEWWDIYQFSLLSNEYENRKKYEIISKGIIQLKAKRVKENFSKQTKKLIDEIWSIENSARNNNLLNGTVLSYNDHKIISKTTFITGKYVSYKSIITSRRSNLLKIKLNQIGVSGIIYLNYDDDYFIIVGRRGKNTFEYSGLLEFIPSGNVEINSFSNFDIVNFKSHLQKELEEELGIKKSNINKIETIGFVKDLNNSVYDICCKIEISSSRLKIKKSFQNKNEYEKIFFIREKDLAKFLKKNYEKFVPTSLAIYECICKD